MSKITFSDAFSTGLGFAMGLVMAQYISQAMKPSEKIIRQLIICLKCGSKNPIENKFCNQCGQAFYPPPQIQCPRCNAMMPKNMNFCGICGLPLKKNEKS